MGSDGFQIAFTYSKLRTYLRPKEDALSSKNIAIFLFFVPLISPLSLSFSPFLLLRSFQQFFVSDRSCVLQMPSILEKKLAKFPIPESSSGGRENNAVFAQTISGAEIENTPG